ncbi:MAG: hypothetical protein EOO71_25525 [Myxococcaceae bacterium]|nr:MAG: hypothetical protein EOO71_25525 [Myxococcaceae bacterium]
MAMVVVSLGLFGTSLLAQDAVSKPESQDSEWTTVEGRVAGATASLLSLDDVKGSGPRETLNLRFKADPAKPEVTEALSTLKARIKKSPEAQTWVRVRFTLDAKGARIAHSVEEIPKPAATQSPAPVPQASAQEEKAPTPPKAQPASTRPTKTGESNSLTGLAKFDKALRNTFRLSAGSETLRFDEPYGSECVREALNGVGPEDEVHVSYSIEQGRPVAWSLTKRAGDSKQKVEEGTLSSIESRGFVLEQEGKPTVFQGAPGSECVMEKVRSFKKGDLLRVTFIDVDTRPLLLSVDQVEPPSR